MNDAMQNQLINSGSSNEGSHDSGSGSGNSQNDQMRRQMMMQMMMAGSSGGADPRVMMQRMMAGGPLDTSNSGVNLESTRNNELIEFSAPPGMLPPPGMIERIM